MNRKKTSCPVCGKGKLVEAGDVISEIEGHFFVENGRRCVNCGEEFVGEKQGQKTIEAAKKLGLWNESPNFYGKK